MNKSRGYVLITLLVALALGSAAYLGSTMGLVQTNVTARARVGSSQALANAKQALILRSVLEPNTPGSFICGATANGLTVTSCSAETASAPQRFPFRTLGTPRLEDGSGQCLWYALSPTFRNTIGTANRESQNSEKGLINLDTYGQLSVRDGSAIPGLTGSAVAILLAPDAPLPSQHRGAESAAHCQEGDYKEFLEAYDISAKTFTARSESTANFSDQVAVITRLDVMRPLIRHVITQFAWREKNKEPTKGLRWFLKQLVSTGKSISDLQLSVPGEEIHGLQATVRLNRSAFTTKRFELPTDPMHDAQEDLFESTLQFDEIFMAKKDFKLDFESGCNENSLADPSYAAPSAWLCFNKWYDYIEYELLTPTTARISLTLETGYACSLTVSTSDTNKADSVVCNEGK